MRLDQTTADAVFAAATRAHWTLTTLGRRAEVHHGQATYTVEIPPSGRELAEIVYRHSFGGLEYLHGAHATPEQHHRLIAAAYAATNLT
jgi:hypothetical protein